MSGGGGVGSVWRYRAGEAPNDSCKDDTFVILEFRGTQFLLATRIQAGLSPVFWISRFDWNRSFEPTGGYNF